MKGLLVRAGMVLACIMAAGAPVAAQQITGAGSTFVYPMMSKWAASYHDANPSVQINYQSIGSGGGIQQLKAGTVDFGASDAPLSDAEAKEMPAPVVQFPVIAGAEAIVYNVPGVPSGP